MKIGKCLSREAELAAGAEVFWTIRTPRGKNLCMYKTMIRNVVFLLSLSATPAYTQQEPSAEPFAALLKIAEQPDLDAPQFEQALGSVLPSTRLARELPDLPFEDPFLWFFIHTLGDPSSETRKTLTCSRHGMATRDWFAVNRNGSMKSALLASAVFPLENNQQEWPEGAVAQLHCQFPLEAVGQDGIFLTEEEARAALAMFETVSGPMEPELRALIFGPDGYSVQGMGGKSNSTVYVSSARIMRFPSQQFFEFSSFLINPGS